MLAPNPIIIRGNKSISWASLHGGLWFLLHWIRPGFLSCNGSLGSACPPGSTSAFYESFGTLASVPGLARAAQDLAGHRAAHVVERRGCGGRWFRHGTAATEARA